LNPSLECGDLEEAEVCLSHVVKVHDAVLPGEVVGKTLDLVVDDAEVRDAVVNGVDALEVN
jgi:hypothetical protein